MGTETCVSTPVSNERISSCTFQRSLPQNQRVTALFCGSFINGEILWRGRNRSRGWAGNTRNTKSHDGPGLTVMNEVFSRLWTAHHMVETVTSQSDHVYIRLFWPYHSHRVCSVCSKLKHLFSDSLCEAWRAATHNWLYSQALLNVKSLPLMPWA